MQKFLLVLLFISINTIAAEKSVMVYRYWDFGSSEKRDQYQFELLHNILEKTVPAYGKYELIKVEKKYTSTRASREISRGEIINIEASPHHPPYLKRPGLAGTDSSIITPDIKTDNPKINIPRPLLHGLLGYRKIVVRREDLDKFTGITKVDELKNLIAGQGKDWEDVIIYKANGFKVSDNSDIENLFSMLTARRFDYIPLSILEIDDVLKEFPKHADEIAIVPNIIIYYPFPVLFNTSIHNPELAERVEKGLALAEADGSINRTFEKYFADEVKELQSNKNKIFVLHNPNIPEWMGLNKPLFIHHKN